MPEMLTMTFLCSLKACTQASAAQPTVTGGPIKQSFDLWRVSRSRFSCPQNQTLFCQHFDGWFSSHLATTCKSMTPRNVWERIFEHFLFRGSFAPPPKKKTSKLKCSKHVAYINVTNLGYSPRTAVRYCLLVVVVQGPGTWVFNSVSFCMTDSFGATGRQSSQFFAYCLFSHTRCLKRRAYLFCARPTAKELHCKNGQTYYVL